jgi:pimeloyl-ACP methyl ester carboxylesterase
MTSSIWVDLMGCEVKYVQGAKYRSRILEAGQGEHVILFHGLGGHVETYSRNLMALARHFHVVAIELLWHGYSTKAPFEDDQVAQLAGQVLDVMDAMGIPHAHMEGEAIGASAVLWLAVRHPERVGKIILESGGSVAFKPGAVKTPDPAGMAGHLEDTLEALANPTNDTVRRRLERVMHNPSAVTEELVAVRQAHYARVDVSEAMTEAYRRLRSAPPSFQEEDLSAVKAPALVVWNDSSTGWGPDAGERLASLIPGAEYHLMENTSYWGHWEWWQEHNEMVLRFLKGGG